MMGDYEKKRNRKRKKRIKERGMWDMRCMESEKIVRKIYENDKDVSEM